MLAIRQDTLEFIHLGIIPEPQEGDSMPDFSNFPVLEELVMSAWNTIRSENPFGLLEKTNTPSLRKLTLDFFTEESIFTGIEEGRWRKHELRSTDFGADQLTWMTDLASLRKSEYPTSG